MFRRKLIAGVAALTAAASIAIPAASASAQPATVGYTFTPSYGFCASLIPEIQFATATGNLAWASAFSNVFVYSHCGGAAI